MEIYRNLKENCRISGVISDRWNELGLPLREYAIRHKVTNGISGLCALCPHPINACSRMIVSLSRQSQAYLCLYRLRFSCRLIREMLSQSY